MAARWMAKEIAPTTINMPSDQRLRTNPTSAFWVTEICWGFDA
jgi:hypothetical protein